VNDESALVPASVSLTHDEGTAMQKITTWLWFDTEAEEAAEFYTSVFPDSRITDVSRYGEAGPRPAGTVMTVSFELMGREFVGLNGGPEHRIEGAGISFMVECESQEEVDAYWGPLADGGVEIACGWVSDRYGVAWQIVPRRLRELLTDPDRDKAQRVMAAMLQMTKIEVAGLERAAAAA
jgi:predicted 3-demethylubiquinone-9 3-methyltransferase (glyoxalase superfamily)